MRTRLGWIGWVGVLAAGCAGPPVVVPPGHRPSPTPPPDVRTAAVLVAASPAPPAGPVLAPPRPVGDPKLPAFQLPPGLPGSDARPVVPPALGEKTPIADRVKAVRAVYPPVTPLGGAGIPAAGQPLSLADLQALALQNSPVLRRAAADADAAYGAVIQAGLYPNPTVGYQGDQIQPGLRLPPGDPGSGAGQQGAFVSQVIKTAGKLPLAQAVAGYDYLNAVVAVRRAEVDVAAAVRAQFFAVLVAEQGVEVNRALSGLADDVYRVLLTLLAAGQADGNTPLQVYAQAEQARNALTLAEADYRAAWRQLAAAVGRPELPPARLAGRADAPAPDLPFEAVRVRMLDRHTDLLTARNTVLQAETDLRRQKVTPVPDVATNQYHQYDALSRTYQFGVQVGVELPVADRNQGNVRRAAARVVRANEDLDATRNALLGRLADAYGRYEANRVIAARYRDTILPNLNRAYAGLARRYQVDEPGRVPFTDLVVAQQNLAAALQSYLAAVGGQWRAAVEVAAAAQLDDLDPGPAAVEVDTGRPGGR